MIGDAIETMLYNAHHFNPEKSKNPFAYLTKITYHSFIHRIKREKKEEYTKFKVTEHQVLLGTMSSGSSENKGLDGAVDLGTDYYNKLALEFEKPKKEKPSGLEKFS